MEVVARENTVTVIDHHTRQRTVAEESDPMEVPILESDSRFPEGVHWSGASAGLRSVLMGRRLS